MPIHQTAKVTGQSLGPATKHYRGLPPAITGGKDQRELMKAPVLIAIEEKSDGVFLLRFGADGQLVGDTWHMTVEEAKQQARFEFGDLLQWKAVPDGWPVP